MNKALLIGNVGKDPIVATLQNGNRVASFSLATSEKWKKDGEQQERTEWHEIVVFNDHLIKLLENYVRKGSKLCVEGQIQTRKFTDKKTNQEKYKIEIVLQRFNGAIELLDSRLKEPEISDDDGWPS